VQTKLLFIPTGIQFYITFEEFKAVLDTLWEFAIEKDYGERSPQKGKQFWGKAFEKEITRVPIPYASFKIPRLMSIGLGGVFSMNFEFQTFGRFAFNTGAEVKVPKGAKLTIDMMNPALIVPSKFGGAGIDWFFRPKSGNGELNALFYPGWGLYLGASLAGQLLEMRNVLRAPAFNLNLTAGYGEFSWIP
jgi:hypothetical protein